MGTDYKLQFSLYLEVLCTIKSHTESFSLFLISLLIEKKLALENFNSMNTFMWMDKKFHLSSHFGHLAKDILYNNAHLVVCCNLHKNIIHTKFIITHI